LTTVARVYSRPINYQSGNREGDQDDQTKQESQRAGS
jgi:hypothetical protein